MCKKGDNYSKYEDLLASAPKAGVNRMNGFNFIVADTKKYREEARLKAVKAAREKAITMAAELGQAVGKAWEVREAADYDAEAYLTANTRQYLQSLENR